MSFQDNESKIEAKSVTYILSTMHAGFRGYCNSEIWPYTAPRIASVQQVRQPLKTHNEWIPAGESYISPALPRSQTLV